MPAIQTIHLSCARRQVLRGTLLLLSCFVFDYANIQTARAELPQRQIERPLQPAEVTSAFVRSVTGVRIAIDQRRPIIRGWTGILTDHTGGALRSIVMNRHHAATTAAVQNPTGIDGCGPQEASLRQRHSQVSRPRYFDLIVLETKTKQGRLELLAAVDEDLDRSITDESLTLVQLDPHSGAVPDGAPLNLVLSAAGLGVAATTEFQTGPPERQPRETQPDSATVPDANANENTSRWPDIQQLQHHQAFLQRLRARDEASVRKQHLPSVVAAADQLIERLEANDPRDQPFLIEALYRKGRALGYQELPDVVRRFPVENPERLQQQFESNFQQLAKLIDPTSPKFILLHVRRERRRGCYGHALQLVERYQETHPNPVWYHKKRFDLLRAFTDGLVVHQAAADLWLHGQQPIPWTAPAIDNELQVPRQAGAEQAR